MQMEIEKITSIIPEAEISQTGETVVKVPAEKLHQIEVYLGIVAFNDFRTGL